MTYEEAIAIEHEITMMLVANVKEEHKDRVFTAHKLAIEALEKQIPKKPVEKIEVCPYDNEEGLYADVMVHCYCPVCGRWVGIPDFGYSMHCDRCGQAIDWSEVE